MLFAFLLTLFMLQNMRNIIRPASASFQSLFTFPSAITGFLIKFKGRELVFVNMKNNDTN